MSEVRTVSRVGALPLCALTELTSDQAQWTVPTRKKICVCTLCSRLAVTYV